MKFPETKRLIGVTILAGLFIGSLLTFCHAMAMPDMGMATHTNIASPVECFSTPSYCPEMVANSLKELLEITPLAHKVLFLFLVFAFLHLVPKLVIYAKEKFLALRFYNAYIPPPNYLELAFARGILHPKLYSAAM